MTTYAGKTKILTKSVPKVLTVCLNQKITKNKGFVPQVTSVPGFHNEKFLMRVFQYMLT